MLLFLWFIISVFKHSWFLSTPGVVSNVTPVRPSSKSNLTTTQYLSYFPNGLSTSPQKIHDCKWIAKPCNVWSPGLHWLNKLFLSNSFKCSSSEKTDKTQCVVKSTKRDYLGRAKTCSTQDETERQLKNKTKNKSIIINNKKDEGWPSQSSYILSRWQINQMMIKFEGLTR